MNAVCGAWFQSIGPELTAIALVLSLIASAWAGYLVGRIHEASAMRWIAENTGDAEHG